MEWKRFGLRARALINEAKIRPYTMVRDAIVCDVACPRARFAHTRLAVVRHGITVVRFCIGRRRGQRGSIVRRGAGHHQCLRRPVCRSVCCEFPSFMIPQSFVSWHRDGTSANQMAQPFITSHQTKTSILTFILAMVLHPEVYRKAQEEVDQVIGADRLPTSADVDSLLFVNCIIKEVFR